MDDNRLSLLLVDDDVRLCESLGCDLRARGFDVCIATGVRDATALAEESPPQFVVLGPKVMDTDGQGLLSRLLRLDSRTRILVLVGGQSVTGAVEAIKLGAPQQLARRANRHDIVEGRQLRERPTGSPPSENPMSLKRVACEHIEKVLRQHNGNISATARALSLHRRTLQRKLSKLPFRK